LTEATKERRCRLCRRRSGHELSGTAARAVRDWLSVRHSFPAEAIAVLGLYGVYEATRGLVVGDSPAAVRHAHEVVSVEQSLHLFVERRVQAAAHAVPGLLGALGVAYLTLHLAVTAAFLVWLYLRCPAAYPLIRTTLFAASVLALAGYLLYPTAPPRLAGIGIADTVSGPHVNLNHGLVSALYNPFAAIPSMHIGYSVVVGGGLLRYGSRREARLVGVLYPLFVLLVIVATGNHFILDAVSGAAVAAVALCVALVLGRTPRPVSSVRRSVTALARGREAPPTRQAA
jgi:PAP2 superfamily